jgi:organic radical activating enzyme
MKLEYADKRTENWFLVSWTLSNKCNYRCEYCPDILHDGSTGQPKWETVKHFVDNLKVDKDICFRMSGGEPTYWKHFYDMAKLVKQCGHNFTYVTNASQSVEYFKKINEYTDGVFLSYHSAYADPQHFIDVCNALDCPKVVAVMLLPEKFDEMYAIAERIHNETNAMVEAKVIVDKVNDEHPTNKVYEYTQEQKEKIKQWPFTRMLDYVGIHRGPLMYDEQLVDANQLILQGDNKFSGWKCWAGVDGINIDMWGNMYRADCQFGGAIGNLERYKLPSDPIMCGKNICSCLSDIYIKKETV